MHEELNQKYLGNLRAFVAQIKTEN